ncbi:EAL domain-containing protein [Lentibacillus halophilus]|uniref:EAL domain-containing protein n=1 Tax=Lentibacillus halophilus TaxID=295065 RepID=A0ABN0Z7K8_9BACI
MNYESELNKELKNRHDIETALNESSIVAVTDHRGVIQSANEKFTELSKYTNEELIGSYQNIINSGYHSRAFFHNLWKTIGSGKVWKGEIKNKAKDGTYYWVETTIMPFLNDNGKPYQYISIRHDITQRKQYEETIKQLAYYDQLTSLPNRHLLNEWGNNLEENHKITVFFLDIDRFKSLNDNYGHYAGDIILQKIADRLRSCLRDSDFIVREGGDEFIILLDNVYKREDIETFASKIIDQFEKPIYIDYQSIRVTTSIGISTNQLLPGHDHRSKAIETFIRNADTAMYHAKKQGGNTYCFNTQSQNHDMERYQHMEHELRFALENDQFTIVYQPFIGLESEEVVGLESLLRWYSPYLGAVSPAEFIPLLEELGLIIPVGKWILKSVCQQLKEWQNEGIFLQRVSVNVSPVQLRNRDFVNDLKAILTETKIDPAYLDLELTEGTILNVSESAAVINDLQALGVNISIDDFGTGYSSLNYLKQLPINTLKIDKSFIHDLDFDDDVIVNTIINMGQNLNFTVLAEGIESYDQLAYLQNQNCHEGQGFYWSKPVNATAIPYLYNNNGQEQYGAPASKH